MAEPSGRWIDSTHAAFIMTFGGVFIGGWISVAGGSIGSNSGNFLRVLQYHLTHFAPVGSPAPDLRIQWWTVTFWMIVLAWAWVLALRLRADGRRDAQRVMDLIHAIHRTPNLNVFRKYPRTYIPSVFASLYGDPGTGEPIDTRIRAVLYAVAEMAREFARADCDIRYGANVMLLSQGKDFPDLLMPTLRFYQGDVGRLALVVHLPGSLCVESIDGKLRENVDATPRISLPVPTSLATVVNGREIVQALPGAPTALFTADGVSMQERTSSMSEQCAGLGAVISEQIAEYFGQSGPGANIRSFVSFRIDRGDSSETRRPVGVLNIDSNQEYLLGRDPEYYLTFFALVSPIFAMLGPLLENYAAEYWKLQLRAPP